MGKNKQKTVIRKTELGRTLFKSRFNKNDESGPTSERWLHTSELEDTSDWSKTKNAKSVTEQNSLDDFLATAELAGTEFESEKLNLHFVVPKPNTGILTKEEAKRVKETQEKHKNCLRIPRRPIWKNADYDAKTLQLKERESFLEWRRSLAKLQENEHLSMTPFEKNLEFWRQLWRVIERSDVIVQIVDARNPLLFYCVDLESYVKEVDSNKQSVILVNKSDLLSAKQRLEWYRYFKSKNIHAIFWSAALATEMDELLDEDDDDKSERHRKDSHQSDWTEEDENDDDDDDDDDEDELSDLQEESEDDNENLVVNKFKVLTDEKSDGESESASQEEEEEENDEENESESEHEEQLVTVKEEIKRTQDKLSNLVFHESVDNNKNEKEETIEQLNMTEDEKENSKILNRHELITFLKTVHKSVDKAKPGLNTIGLVGYPNVGKSSTINALLKDKKTAVSDTPGKTKHYQTLFVDDELLLCDCPGLVFPSFISTRGELILNGILPIDQMRDYVEPVNLATSHIPRNTFEMFYGIEIAKPKEGEDLHRRPTAEELCTAYSVYRGYMNHKGTPDVQRGARYILKDYVNGKLLFCYPPPGVEAESFQDHKYEMSKEAKYLLKMNKLNKQQKKPQLSNFDQDFFTNSQPRALTKGGIVGYHRHSQAVQRGTDLNDLINKQEGKPWKKHNNKNKREKLRRKTSHFDQVVY